jgi:zinc protease
MAGIYKFPEIEEVVLSNGLRLIMVPDDEQDGLIAIIQFSIGTFSDPSGMEGTVELCTRLLQKGCGQLNAEQFNEKMEYAGASLFSDIGEEHVAIGVRMLASKQQEIFPLFWKMISDPKMEQHEFAMLQREMITALKAEISEPGVLVNRHFYRELVGEEHPAGRFYSTGSVKKITVEMVRNFYKDYFSPSKAILAVAGKFDPHDFKESNLSVLLEFNNVNSAASVVASAVAQPRRVVRMIDKPILTQSSIIIGHSAPGEIFARKAELILANYIFGGGNFSSRLMSRIRSTDGRTYGISSQIASERYFGAFLIQTSTQNNQVSTVIRSILDVFKDFSENGVEQKELENAKQFAIGNMAFQLEGIGNIAEKLLWLRFYDRADSYIENFDSMINQISLDSINETIRSCFSPENAIIAIVGRKAEIYKQLKEFGPVSSFHYRDRF